MPKNEYGYSEQLSQRAACVSIKLGHMLYVLQLSQMATYSLFLSRILCCCFGGGRSEGLSGELGRGLGRGSGGGLGGDLGGDLGRSGNSSRTLSLGLGNCLLGQVSLGTIRSMASFINNG